MKKWINIVKALKLPVTTTEPLSIYVDRDSITSVHFYKDHDKEVYGICVWVADELNPYIAEYKDKTAYQSAQGILLHMMNSDTAYDEPKKTEEPCSKPKQKSKKVSTGIKSRRGRKKSK